MEFAKSKETRLRRSKTKVYGLMRQRFTLTEVMERQICEEGNPNPNTQAHLWNKVEIISWFGLAWILLGRAH